MLHFKNLRGPLPIALLRTDGGFPSWLREDSLSMAGKRPARRRATGV